LELTSLLLPVKHSHGVTNLLLLLPRFGHLTLELLLRIQLPQLRIHLLLDHLVLNLAALVDQLLLPLDGSTIVVELLVFLPQCVVRCLELHVLAPLDFADALSLTLRLQLGQPGEHLLTHLLWRLKTVLELLLVDAVLSIKHGSQLGLPLLQVARLPLLHVSNAVLHNVLLNELLRLLLPEGLVAQVVKSLNVVNLLGIFLNTETQGGFSNLNFDTWGFPVLTNSASRRAWMCASDLNFVAVYTHEHIS